MKLQDLKNQHETLLKVANLQPSLASAFREIFEVLQNEIVQREQKLNDSE